VTGRPATMREIRREVRGGDDGGDDELAEEIAQMLVRVEANYRREGSGPGSRFEGQCLETAQARRVIREIRERDAAAAGRAGERK